MEISKKNTSLIFVLIGIVLLVTSYTILKKYQLELSGLSVPIILGSIISYFIAGRNSESNPPSKITNITLALVGGAISVILLAAIYLVFFFKV